MNSGKPRWGQEPPPDQTSIRFCCPHCFSWVRNREFEQHLKLAHPELDPQGEIATRQSLD